MLAGRGPQPHVVTKGTPERIDQGGPRSACSISSLLLRASCRGFEIPAP